MKIFLITLSLVFGLRSNAQVFPAPTAVVSGSSTMGTAVLTTTPVSGAPAYTPMVVGNPTVSTTTAIQNNGQNASQQQGAGGAAAAAAMAAMAATAAATCPACGVRGTCPICAASLIGAAASGLTGSNMDNAQAQSNAQVQAVNPTAKPVAPSFVSSPLYTAAGKDIQTATKGTGFTLSKDLKTLMTPDGRTINTAAAATGGAGGGMTGPELKAFKEQVSKAQDLIKKMGADGKESPEDVAGSGAGGSAATNSDAKGEVAGRALPTRGPANIAGAYKDLNGDRIGVSVDSMFEMMHRRYKANSDREFFIPPTK